MRSLSFLVFLLGVPLLGQFAGELDQSFNSIDVGFDDPSTGANGEIRRMIALDNGTILIGGVFTTYNGVVRIGLARVHPDGSLDASFTAPAMTVLDMVRTDDGRVIVAGSTIVDGTAYQLFRLLPDGSLDPSFPLINGTSLQPLGPVQDNVVQSVSIGPDQFLYFSHTALVSTGGGSVRLTRVRRVDLSGGLDASYLSLSVSDSYGMSGVTGMVHQADGKLLVHGKFFSPTNRCMRMNADFSVDYSISGVSSNLIIQDMVVQPDGKIIYGYRWITPSALPLINRLAPNGTVDNTFNIGTGFQSIGNLGVTSILLNTDGSMIIAGGFTSYNGIAKNCLVRLLYDGTLDTTFDPGTGGRDILDMARHTNGNILITGTFVSYDGVGRNRLARINDHDPVTQLSARVLLGGAYDAAMYMLEDGLRASGLIPMIEPYTALGYIHADEGGAEELAAGATSILGSNAIVDWVVVELLSPAPPVAVIESRSAVVQRDGDVVAVDGVSPVSFNVPYGNYHIAIRHRNHLGVMSAAPIALSSSVSFIDFTNPATATYGTNAQQNINGTMVLWPGDANFNGEVKYTGTGNDRDLILTAIGGATPTNTVTNTYSPLDINMDGTIRYTGTNNDRDIILQTIGGVVPTAALIQQLP